MTSKNNHNGQNLYEVADEKRNRSFGLGSAKAPKGPLNVRFGYPPSSCFNTREENWIKRRRRWLKLGIRSEVGRGENLVYQLKETLSDGSKAARHDSQTSIFDPVLAELCCNFWGQPGGIILDPFAGGSVRGIIASILGFRYYGIELRPEQVEANYAQLAELKELIKDLGGKPPKWVCGDSLEKLDDAPRADFVFSCPPYGNLEKYSDLEGDISKMTYAEFLEAYGEIISKAASKLKNNRFACFVVANYRDRNKGGGLVDFVGDTTFAFEASGCRFYNEIILLNNFGTGAMRAATNFCRGACKVVKTHQNVLVYCKGDPKKAAKRIPRPTWDGESGADKWSQHSAL